jgi:hypothetical protein
MEYKETKATIYNAVRTLRLLKQANCEDHVPLAELAREMKTSKTELMSLINHHPDLFVTEAPNLKKTGGRNPGLLIRDAFATAEENYTTPEFLERLREENRMTVHVTEHGSYGQVQGYYACPDEKYRDGYGHEAPDSPDHRKNTHLWRNTAEKLSRLDATGHSRRGYFWDLTEGRSQVWFDHVLTEDDLRALKAEGWSFTGRLPEGI